MSAPALPVWVLLALPAALTVTGTVPVFCPSETVIVKTAVPVLPDTAVAVRVRASPAPPKTRLPLALGTSAGLLDWALIVRVRLRYRHREPSG
jgi:hypothetical protein